MKTILYHITEAENITGIMKNGIIPKNLYGIKLFNREELQKLFAALGYKSSFPEDIGEYYVTRKQATILEIDCTDLQIYSRFHLTVEKNPDPVDKIYYTTNIIDPERIMCVITDPWILY